MNSDFTELDGRDPRAVLGVERDVSDDEVVRAYRRRAARGGHPDAGGDDSTFRQLTRARDILLDPRRRIAYDAARRPGRMDREFRGTTRRGAPPSSFGRGMSGQPRDSAGGGPRTDPRPASVSPAPAGSNPWAVVTVVLALLGPLLWPAAMVTGLLALWRTKRTGGDDRGGGTRVSAALTLFFALSVFVLPSVVTLTVVILA
ncbi:J domain-containing protein [Haloactinopolyspora alba]|uniref:J domain-containing protein n=1 Tax=Haloactinopolyspora alba TaxID=648780 RepID=UPI001F0D06B2|nr:DnaJ domain-containing protein [Haloactinopolyspora alba]